MSAAEPGDKPCVLQNTTRNWAHWRNIPIMQTSEGAINVFGNLSTFWLDSRSSLRQGSLQFRPPKPALRTPNGAPDGCIFGPPCCWIPSILHATKQSTPSEPQPLTFHQPTFHGQRPPLRTTLQLPVQSPPLPKCPMLSLLSPMLGVIQVELSSRQSLKWGASIRRPETADKLYSAALMYTNRPTKQYQTGSFRWRLLLAHLAS